MPTYSWCGTPIHLPMTDDTAAAYNRIVDVFKGVAYISNNKKIRIEAAHKDIVVFNKIAQIVNILIKLNGGSMPYTDESITTDYLVKV